MGLTKGTVAYGMANGWTNGQAGRVRQTLTFKSERGRAQGRGARAQIRPHQVPRETPSAAGPVDAENGYLKHCVLRGRRAPRWAQSLPRWHQVPPRPPRNLAF
eukprot:scaffold55918_cov35-Tisochrysis_lutea.AAC.4